MAAPASQTTSDSNSTTSADSKPQPQGDLHVVVFVHGLWGNPAHLQNLSNSLKAVYPDLHMLIVKRNTGNFTYDGIELGGERVTNEIEDELASLKKDGKTTSRISFVGYSMGGLVARYSIGLLYSKGVIGTGPDAIQPVNFTTFASPHIGTRTPLIGWQNNVWNSLGARSLSASGNQMWTIDQFRDTGRPLLAVMADPGSIFMRGLAAFRKRSLYANVINDRAVPFYTSYISDIDPFADMSAIKIHYEPGYQDVIISPTLATPKDTPATWYEKSSVVAGKMPFYIFAGIFAPVGAAVFLGNAAVQSFQSAQRIKLHEEGGSGIDISGYRSSPMLEAMQKKADETLQRLNSAEGEDYLPAEKGNAAAKSGDDSSESLTSTSLFPRLALTDDQFAMKASLDALGIEKYAVHIHSANHSHAAIIVRFNRPGFGDGKIVAKHWTERFEV